MLVFRKGKVVIEKLAQQHWDFVRFSMLFQNPNQSSFNMTKNSVALVENYDGDETSLIP